MPRKIFINKSLLKLIQDGDETDIISMLHLDEGVFITDRTEACIELVPTLDL